MKYNIKYACTSHIGRRRANHEDNFWCAGDHMPPDNTGTPGVLSGCINEKEFPAFAVFDGMGGESCGEEAAAAAAEAFGVYYTKNKNVFPADPEAFIRNISLEMNNQVCGFAERNHIRSMGSTVVMALFAKTRYVVSNLGDSRIYLCQDRKMSQLSTDHVFYGSGYRKPPLVQFLGLREDEGEPEPTCVQGKISPGMRILLCTDGVTDMIADAELEQLLLMEAPVSEIAGKILELALENGGRDNITLILLEAVPGKGEKTQPGFFKRVFGKNS